MEFGKRRLINDHLNERPSRIQLPVLVCVECCGMRWSGVGAPIITFTVCLE